MPYCQKKRIKSHKFKLEDIVILFLKINFHINLEFLNLSLN